MGFFSEEPSPEELQQRVERAKAEREIEEQKAEKMRLVAEAKRRYGKDWSKMFSGFAGGIDWQKLKFQVGQNGRR